MSNEPHGHMATADAQSAKPQHSPRPRLAEPFDVEHVTMSGGIFGGLDVIRGEYIDRSRPRRGWLHKLLRGS